MQIVFMQSRFNKSIPEILRVAQNASLAIVPERNLRDSNFPGMWQSVKRILVIGAHRDEPSDDFQGCCMIEQREPTSTVLITKSLSMTAQSSRPSALRSLALDLASISGSPTAEATST